MSEQIPVNPVMLRWARKTGGFDIDDVVGKLDRKRITSETVASWEKGAASPTYVQLERLAYEIAIEEGATILRIGSAIFAG